MSQFTVAQFQNFARSINCMGFEEFEEMYKLLGFGGKAFINEKYELKNVNFLAWMCELSSDSLEKLMFYIG